MTTVLITGANRGIGLGLVRKFLAHDNPPALILATCRDPAKSEALQDIARKNPCVRVLVLDVSDISSFNKFAEDVKAEVGDNGLNVLVNNAGILIRKMNLEEITPEVYSDVFATNVMGPIFLTKALLPLVRLAAEKNKDKPAGVNRAIIANMSSLLGSVHDNGSGGYYSYRESKSALNMFSVNLSKELKSLGILAVPLHPGWVQTDMGGANATVTVDQSSGGLVDVIYNLDESKNGKFFNWDGSVLPW